MGAVLHPHLDRQPALQLGAHPGHARPARAAHPDPLRRHRGRRDPLVRGPFGRDALLTCHQTLMLNPDLTRTTLNVLARYQADEVDKWRDAEPGKILHEFRQGELASAHVIPHSPYYGSVDSTPLWLLLLGTYYRWTDDLAFCRALLPNVERALHWVDHYGDLDGDGFLEYQTS